MQSRAGDSYTGVLDGRRQSLRAGTRPSRRSRARPPVGNVSSSTSPTGLDAAVARALPPEQVRRAVTGTSPGSPVAVIVALSVGLDVRKHRPGSRPERGPRPKPVRAGVATKRCRPTFPRRPDRGFATCRKTSSRSGRYGTRSVARTAVMSEGCGQGSREFLTFSIGVSPRGPERCQVGNADSAVAAARRRSSSSPQTGFRPPPNRSVSGGFSRARRGDDGRDARALQASKRRAVGPTGKWPDRRSAGRPRPRT